MRRIDWGKVGLACLAVGGFGLALYWRHRFDVAVTEGTMWTMQAIQKMEEQRKLIETLQKGESV